MVLFYAIDRFDGQDWAVLEDDAARTFRVPRAWIPAEARERDVIRIETESQGSPPATGLRIAVDADATARRLSQVDQLRQQLPRGPKGDVSL
jgi:hypothetical protein